MICENANHPKVDDGIIQLCLLCHFKTDHAFAVYSQNLLQQIKLKEAA